MNHSTTTKCCNNHFPSLFNIFYNRPTAFCHCPLPLVTVHRLLSPTMDLLLTRRFLSLSTVPILLMPIASYYCLPHLITAHCSLSLPNASYNCPPFNPIAHRFQSLPTASCYSPPLAITNHGFLLLTRSFRSLLTPSCQCPPLSITVYLIQSLPTASYHCPLLPISITHYGSLLLVGLYSIILYPSVISSTVSLSSYNQLMAHFISYAKNIRYFLKPSCTQVKFELQHLTAHVAISQQEC